MPPCDACRDQLLDYLYGLLPQPEVAAVEAHLAGCPACAAARVAAARAQGLIARAAKPVAAGITFAPPAEPTVPAKPAAVAASRNGTPVRAAADEPVRGTVRSTWVRWAVAAGVVLAVAGLGGPAARDLAGFAWYKPPVDRDVAAVRRADETRNELREKFAQAQKDAEVRLAAAKKDHDALVAAWVKAEEKASTAADAQPFHINITGPTTAVPGAPNKYTLNVVAGGNKQVAALNTTIKAEVRDATGAAVLSEEFQPGGNLRAGGAEIHLTPAVWAKVKPGSDLSLYITAVDRKTGANTAFTETIRLQKPQYTTFLTTDKPMYHPGETVRFRSLTLDRTRFLAPDREIVLTYDLTGGPADGVLDTTTGLAKPVTEKFENGFRTVTPVRGPDGKSLRGVGAGEFRVPAAGGEYTISVYESTTEPNGLTNKGKPLATRKFVVAEYTPEKFSKTIEFGGRSYGPGDEVTATITVLDQAKKVAGAKLAVTGRADNNQVVTHATTNADGTALLKYTLPKTDDIRSASLSVEVDVPGDKPETVSRPIPLATRKLNVEFFPEGGNLAAGVRGRVYFRATTTTGKPADIEGTLTDGSKDICEIRTLTDDQNPGVNQGLGVFEFTPEAGKSYFVRLAKPLGIEPPLVVDGRALVGGFAAATGRTGYALPAAKADAVVLTATDAVTKPGQPIRVRLAVAGSKPRSLLVGAYIRGQSVAHQKVTVEPGQPADVALDAGTIKTGGVARVTVFDEAAEVLPGTTQNLEPVAERLVYRQPGEVLNLKVEARDGAGAAKPGAFVPGEAARLDIAATTEAGAPAAAVLWTAVVNKSVLAMADEKTARLMPTHFLLAGETQNPNDLEHADFLLTDHPKAAPALDLLLGTQGWRRFLEQGGQFHRTDDIRADDLMVAYGAGPVPTTWRAGVRKVFDEYWPKYESALLNLEAAEAGTVTFASSGNLEVDLGTAEANYADSLTRLGGSAAGLAMFDAEMADRKTWLPAAAFGLVAVGLLLLAAGYTRPAGAAERKPLTTGAVSLFALTGFLMLAVGLTQSGSGEWRAWAAKAPQPSHDRYAVAAAAQAMVPPSVDELNAIGQAEPGVDARDEARRLNEGGIPGAAAPLAKFGMAAGEGRGEKELKDAGLAFKKHNGDKFREAENQAKEFDNFRRNRFVPGYAGRPVPTGAGAGMPPMAPGKPGDYIGGRLDAKADRGDGKGGGFGDRFAGRGRALRQKDMPGAGPGRKQLEPFDGDKRKAEQQLRQDFRRFDRDAAELTDEGLPYAAAVRLKGAVFLLAQDELGKEALAKPTTGDKQPANGALLQQQKAGNLALKAWNLIQQGIPKAAPFVVREYAHPVNPDTNPNRTRDDFTETVLWHPALVTPADGKVSVPFALSDAINPYEILVAGHTLDGRIGAVKATIEVRKPFALDFRLPQEIGSGDKIDVPVSVTNATAQALAADVKVTGTGFAVDRKDFAANLNATTNGRQFVRVTPTKAGPVSVAFAGTTTRGLSDTILRSTKVVTDGFPAEGSEGGTLEQVGRVKVQVPPVRVPNTLTATVTVFPSTLSELQSGLDGLLREPHGCFEQSSTSNYPNVLISEYMRENKLANPAVTRRADDLMDQGYRKLVGFECRKPTHGQEGYEWFGGTAPPHEALTAYGLLQFTDMARVYKVDPDMLKRTKQYLLDARDGQGGFKRNARAIDTFGRAPVHVTDAYIVWAITEAEKAGEKSDLTKELDKSIALATGDGPAAKDPYFLALVGTAALNADRRKDGVAVLQKIAALQAADGSIPGAETSITRSYGRDLLIETTALAVLGWTKANRADLFVAPSQKAMKWIGKQRDAGGSFGSTQSTILALKALIENARANRRPAESGTVTVYVNDVKVGETKFTTETTDPITVAIPNPEAAFEKGQAEVRVETTAKQAYPYTVAWACRGRQPVASDKCQVRLATAFDKTDVTEGDVLRLNVSVENLKTTDHGMVTAVVGLPAGVKLPENMQQLKALTARPVDGSEPKLSHWETRGRELVLYWRSMGPQQKFDLTLDVIAEIPGEYHAPASRAYLYYNADHKHWVKPLDVKIKAKAEPEATAAK